MPRPSFFAAAARLATRLRAWRGRWAALAVMVAFLPFAGMFSTSSLFVVRDLSMYFWPKHRWLRDTILSGQWPWWDPYTAGGQSAAADALLQMFFPPTMLLRLVLPEVLGFNLWVGLPFPLAALGLYLFARAQLTRPGAAVAAIVFAVSGPMVSTGNFLNLSWSVALLPWVLWATHRVVDQMSKRTAVLLAVIVAAQILSGEPVTMAATMLLAVAYASWGLLEKASGLAHASRVLAVIAGAMMAGAALSAIQLVPLLHAVQHSSRGGENDLFWSVHPGSLVETIAPLLLGDYLQWFSSSFPWMRAFAGGREPFFFSLYCGVPAFAIALVGVGVMKRRWTIFWGATFVLALVLALGPNTPIYPALQQALPILKSFRYPTKYLLFAVLALSLFAGHGWQALVASALRQQPIAWRAKFPAIALAATFAIVGYAATFTALLFPEALAGLILRIATALQVPDRPMAVAWMFGSMEPHGRRLLLLSAAVAFLVWVAAAGRRESRLACGVLLATMCVDLLVNNAPISVQMPVSYLDRPEWVHYLQQQEPTERFYFGGRVRGGLDPRDFDAPISATISGTARSIEIRTMMQGRAVPTSSGFRIRDAISYDLPNLFQADYERFVTRFETASRPQRLTFFSNAGVRYCVMPVPPRSDATALAEVPALEGMKLYDCDPQASRVRVVPPWGVVEPDEQKQIDTLFDASFDAKRTLLLFADPPPAAGTSGPPASSNHAEITSDRSTEVEVAAGVGAQGGFLVLDDTYDDDWHVEVDGRPAAMLKANALFRAVRLAPGEHRVQFHYRPQPVLYGALLSGGALLGLIATALWPRRQRAISSLEVPLSVASTPSA